jgi:hypothetical protein
MGIVDLGVLVKDLFAQRNEGVVIPYERKSMEGWNPQEHSCHDNVDHYIKQNPGCKSVRGWLVFNCHTTASQLIPSLRMPAAGSLTSRPAAHHSVTHSLGTQGLTTNLKLSFR